MQPNGKESDEAEPDESSFENVEVDSFSFGADVSEPKPEIDEAKLQRTPKHRKQILIIIFDLEWKFMERLWGIGPTTTIYFKPNV